MSDSEGVQNKEYMNVCLCVCVCVCTDTTILPKYLSLKIWKNVLTQNIFLSLE